MDEADDEFVEWYGSAYNRVRATLTLALGNEWLAAEATAEAFARALTQWSRVRLTRSPTAWVHTVALNSARSTLRRLVLERRYLERQREGTIPPPPAPDDALWRAVSALPTRARTAVALRYVAGLPEADVADAMGIARGTVAATLHEARRQLGVSLAAAGYQRSET